MPAKCISCPNNLLRKKEKERKQLADTQQPPMSGIFYQFPTFRKQFTTELCIYESVFMWYYRVNALRTV